jgi:hypothetical protein
MAFFSSDDSILRGSGHSAPLLANRFTISDMRRLVLRYKYEKEFWTCSDCDWQLPYANNVASEPLNRVFDSHACDMYKAERKHPENDTPPPATI